MKTLRCKIATKTSAKTSPSLRIQSELFRIDVKHILNK